MNARRCELIDAEVERGLTAGESVELANLQNRMLGDRKAVAPLPTEEARETLRHLLTESSTSEQESAGDGQPQ